MAEDIFPQSLAVCETKVRGLCIEIVVGNPFEFDFTEEFYGALFQLPGKSGEINDYTDLIAELKEKNIQVTIAADLMALALIDRKSTRLNSSHVKISYAVFCLKK